MWASEKIARFVVETDLAAMPPEVIGITRKAFLDTIGVALAGSVDPAGKIVTRFVEGLASRPSATIIGSRARAAAPLAALANGTMAHALDYDDAGAYTQGHPSTVLMPTVFALAEELGSSGTQIIEAYVLGIEAWAAVGHALPMLHLRGWHPTAVLGAFGAAAAAANLLALDAEQTANALGIAASEAAGVGQNFGTMTKPFHAGNAAKSGIVAAMLAKDGFTAARDVIEGEMGFATAFSGGSAEAMKIGENLGAPFALLARGINFKRYPSCAGTHRPIDAILHLIETHDIKPAEVAAIDCLVSPRARKILFYDHPATGFEAKFSAQFVLAAALRDRKIELAHFTDEQARDPHLQDIMARVSLRVHPDWVKGKDTDARPDVVVIRLRDGREYSHGVALARGHARTPLTDAELMAKFRECAGLVLRPEAIERCIELVGRLEKLENVRELIGLLAPVPG